MRPQYFMPALNIALITPTISYALGIRGFHALGARNDATDGQLSGVESEILERDVPGSPYSYSYPYIPTRSQRPGSVSTTTSYSTSSGIPTNATTTSTSITTTTTIPNSVTSHSTNSSPALTTRSTPTSITGNVSTVTVITSVRTRVSTNLSVTTPIIVSVSHTSRMSTARNTTHTHYRTSSATTLPTSNSTILLPPVTASGSYMPSAPFSNSTIHTTNVIVPSTATTANTASDTSATMVPIPSSGSTTHSRTRSTTDSSNTNSAPLVLPTTNLAVDAVVTSGTTIMLSVSFPPSTTASGTIVGSVSVSSISFSSISASSTSGSTTPIANPSHTTTKAASTTTTASTSTLSSKSSKTKTSTHTTNLFSPSSTAAASTPTQSSQSTATIITINPPLTTVTPPLATPTVATVAAVSTVNGNVVPTYTGAASRVRVFGAGTGFGGVVVAAFAFFL